MPSRLCPGLGPHLDYCNRTPTVGADRPTGRNSLGGELPQQCDRIIHRFDTSSHKTLACMSGGDLDVPSDLLSPWPRRICQCHCGADCPEAVWVPLLEVVGIEDALVRSPNGSPSPERRTTPPTSDDSSRLGFASARSGT